EITTDEFGCGLDGLLRYRKSVLFGILNGVDYEEWNTINDSYIPQHYSPDDFKGKAVNKLKLQQELGLPVDVTVPVFASIGRLVEQKGVDILLTVLPEMLAAKLQFVLLGTGTPDCENVFEKLAAQF